MDQQQQDLLKQVLPEGFRLEMRDGLRPRFVIQDEEGEELMQVVSTTARGAVVELMEQSRRNGVNEGRYAKQREVLTAFGVTEVVNTLQNRLIDLIEKKNR